MDDKINEVANVLKNIAAGKTKIDKSSEWGYCTDLSIEAAGYKITIFIDCDEVDYVDIATTPDGTDVTFEQWHEDTGINPMDMLSETEKDQLQDVLFAASKGKE